jgi:hypothetical protein
VAFDGVGQEVGEGLEELSVVLAELTPGFGKKSEHAERALFALDDHAQAASQAGLEEKRRAGESGFMGQIRQE